jgi:hypothetical protein
MERMLKRETEMVDVVAFPATRAGFAAQECYCLGNGGPITS